MKHKRQVRQNVEKLSMYELDGTIVSAIKVLQQLNKECKGMGTVNLNYIEATCDNWGDSHAYFNVYVERPETKKEKEEREASELKRATEMKEQDRLMYEKLKKEFDND